jgi:hypothetical protein
VTEKYIFGSGVREHILKMSNMASMLKPMDMSLKDETVVHLVMASCLRSLRLLRLTTILSLKVGVLRSSLLCVFRRRGLRSHMVILSTT